MSLSASRLIARIISENGTTFCAEIDLSSDQHHIIAISLHRSQAEAMAWVEAEAKAYGLDAEWDSWSARERAADIIGATSQDQTSEPIPSGRSRRSRSFPSLILPFAGDFDVSMLQLSDQCFEILQQCGIT